MLGAIDIGSIQRIECFSKMQDSLPVHIFLLSQLAASLNGMDNAICFVYNSVMTAHLEGK
jgi:hypothetical protein